MCTSTSRVVFVHVTWFCEVSVAYTKGLLLAWGHTYNCMVCVLEGHDPPPPPLLLWIVLLALLVKFTLAPQNRAIPIGQEQSCGLEECMLGFGSKVGKNEVEFNVIVSNLDNLHSRKYSSWLEKPIFKLDFNLEFENKVRWRGVLDLKSLEHGPWCEPTLSSVCNSQKGFLLINPSFRGHMNYLAISNSIDIYDCWIGLDQIGSCHIQF